MQSKMIKKTGSNATPGRAWQRMLSGRRLDLLDPSPLDIEIEDIAHGLARVARWNGQTKGDHAFSVAQHSMLVQDILVVLYPDAPRTWRLIALLHDAPEYVIGDMITPFKSAMGDGYKVYEDRLMAAVSTRFSLPLNPPVTVSRLVKQSDKISAFYEAVSLAGFEEDEARKLFGSPDSISMESDLEFRNLRPMQASEAQTRFLKLFEKLTR